MLAQPGPRSFQRVSACAIHAFTETTHYPCLLRARSEPDCLASSWLGDLYQPCRVVVPSSGK